MKTDCFLVICKIALNGIASAQRLETAVDAFIGTAYEQARGVPRDNQQAAMVS